MVAIQKKDLVILKYSPLTIPKSSCARYDAKKCTKVGVIDPMGKEKSVIKELRLAKIPQSETERFLVIKRLNKKLKILAKIEPIKSIKLPDIKGCLIKMFIFFLIYCQAIKQPREKKAYKIVNANRKTLSNTRCTVLFFKLAKIVNTGKATNTYLGSEDKVPVNVGTTTARREKIK